MANTVSLRSVNNFVLEKHHLSEVSKIDNILKITEDICGLHGTGTIEPYISLHARTPDFSKKNLEDELYIRKKLGRIRCMRRTLFILTKDLIPIMNKATESLRNKRFEDYFKIGDYSEKEFYEYKEKIMLLLAKEEFSASELKKKLDASKSLSFLISILCDQMDLVRGKPIKGWKDRRIKYGLFTSHFPDIKLDNLSEDRAIELLISRYLQSYSPSTLKDIVWWTGLQKRKIKNSLIHLENKIQYINIEGLKGEYIIYKDNLKRLKNDLSNSTFCINFLPNSDPFLLGYKDRERYLDTELKPTVFDRSGNVTSTIILNGRIIGVWDFSRSGKNVVKLHLFSDVGPNVLKKIRYHAERIGNFLFNSAYKIIQCNEMVPLIERTAGNFMTPLKTL